MPGTCDLTLPAALVVVNYLDADSESIYLGLTQNGYATISLSTAGAGFDWLG